MGQPYVGEIRMFAGNFAPAGWELCQGQILPISEYETLFQLIGTTYGGDGESTFAVPNLSGRLPVHMGTGSSGTTYQIGEMSGVESVTLSVNQIPNHTHNYGVVDGAANSRNPINGTWAETSTDRLPYTALSTPVQLGNASTPTGGSQPHDNMQPYLCINFIISLFGIFPSPT